MNYLNDYLINIENRFYEISQGGLIDSDEALGIIYDEMKDFQSDFAIDLDKAIDSLREIAKSLKMDEQI